jgi:hypothetical protein
MVKVRNFLKQLKERVELEVREYENQQHRNTSSSHEGPSNNNAQHNPSLLGLLGSGIEKAVPIIGVVNDALQKSALSDNKPQPRYETVFCETCLQIKGYHGSGSIYYGPGVNISLEDLESAVKDGCHFCSLLTQGLYVLVPDTKGTRAMLNLNAGEKGTVVMRVGRENADIYHSGDWPILEFFTTSSKSRISLLLTPNSDYLDRRSFSAE